MQCLHSWQAAYIPPETVCLKTKKKHGYGGLIFHKINETKKSVGKGSEIGKLNDQIKNKTKKPSASFFLKLLNS